MSKTIATVRMYRLNELGDCFLVTFATGPARAHMLVDCGSFRNSKASIERLKVVTAAIKKDLAGDPLDVVVGTHQHNDHLSGFLHCKTDFKQLKIGQVWLSWLDNPFDKQAQHIGKEHNNLRFQLNAAHKALRRIAERNGTTAPAANRVLGVLSDAMGFFGAADPKDPPEVPAKAVEILKELGGGAKETQYLKPGQVIDFPGMPEGTVKVHVLGPPKDEGDLYRKNPKTGESYDHKLQAAGLLAAQLVRAATSQGNGSSSSEEFAYPFAATYKRRMPSKPSTELKAIMNRYAKRGERWRKIDDDWMQQAAGLALYLDTYTNNSSLVLAIELVESGKVLLFAADAQTGNWSSWKSVKWPGGHPGTDELLARTVLYKVGHHGSHNATLVEAFEKMGGDDLRALIPVHKKDPNITKQNGWKMPAHNLFKRLAERTKGRVLQMDGVNPADFDPTKTKAKKAWAAVGKAPKITDESITIEIA